MLRETIRSVKVRVNIPVTYADVWEYWLRYREIADDVDFVTIHVLPYWENIPVRAEDAAAHVVAIQKQVAACLSRQGNPDRRDRLAKQRTDARRCPSVAHQPGPHRLGDPRSGAGARTFRVNLIEAYDALWKREWEGTVGGNWGLFDGVGEKLAMHPVPKTIPSCPPPTSTRHNKVGRLDQVDANVLAPGRWNLRDDACLVGARRQGTLASVHYWASRSRRSVCPERQAPLASGWQSHARRHLPRGPACSPSR